MRAPTVEFGTAYRIHRENGSFDSLRSLRMTEVKLALSFLCHSEQAEGASKNPYFLRMEFGGRLKSLPYRQMRRVSERRRSILSLDKKCRGIYNFSVFFLVDGDDF